MKARRRTIGRLANEAGVGVETVRFYERKGLLPQPPAQTGGRDYGDEVLWRLHYIRVARGWGWRLTTIKKLIAQAEASPNFCAAIRDVARQRIGEIEREMQKLEAQQQELKAFIESCSAKPDAERCPIFKRIQVGRVKN